MLEETAQGIPRRYAIIAESARVRYALSIRNVLQPDLILRRLYSLYDDFALGIGCDYVVAAICETHEAEGEPERARKFLNHFINKERRERSSLPPEFARFLT
jgi:hypothetical protein